MKLRSAWTEEDWLAEARRRLVSYKEQGLSHVRSVEKFEDLNPPPCVWHFLAITWNYGEDWFLERMAAANLKDPDGVDQGESLVTGVEQEIRANPALRLLL